MFKSNKTPEERLLFWMKRAKRLENRLAYEKSELAAAKEIFGGCQDYLKKRANEYESAIKEANEAVEMAKKLYDDQHVEFLSLVRLYNKEHAKREELEKELNEIKKASSEETAYNSDNFSEIGELPPIRVETVFDNLNSEITDLLLECNLYPTTK